jgi:hemin uptake protein HemP
MSDSSRPAPETPNAYALAPERAVDELTRVISSDTLLGGQSQLAILHNQSVYFLRQTRFGKLILTK